MKRNLWMSTALGVSLVTLLSSAALADPPPANTVIGNQAAASFEANGETYTVESNIVETTINEIYGLNLAVGQTRTSAPGSAVFFPHTITNNGNTTDIFDLVVDAAGGTDNFSLTSVEIFPDADEDGVADTLTPLTETPTISAGARYGVVVRAGVPAGATSGQVSDFVLTATSRGDVAQTSANTDIVSVTTDGIVNLLKDQVVVTDADGDGQPSVGDTIEVTLTYSNTGIGDATSVIITDELPSTNTAGVPVTLTYVDDSGEWSDNPGVVLTEETGNVEHTNGQGTSLEYVVTGSQITAELDTIPAGRSGTITFDYVLTDAPQGTIENTATIESSVQAATQSNLSSINLAADADLVLADAAATASTPGGGVDGAGNLDGADVSATDDDATLNDVVDETTDVFVGQDILFDLVLTNLGNDTDSISLSVSNTDFPAGTQFRLSGADGIAPLVGSEVQLAPNETQHFAVIATLPGSTPITGAPAAFDAVVTAVSEHDAGIRNTTTISYTGIVQPQTVDLVNTDTVGGSVTGGVGAAVDDGGDPWTTLAANPGDTVVFPLRITLAANSPSNTFDLLASTDATFAGLTLPADWTVLFYKDGAPITSTGLLTPAATDLDFDFEARVTPPVDAAVNAAGVNLYFRAESPTNGLVDTKLDAVTINEVVDLSITPDSSVQAAAGGSAIISHTITNLGNSTVTAGAITLGATDPFTDEGMSAALFYDANSDGVLDASDPAISDISSIVGADATAGLSPGEQARIFVRVQAPSTASIGVTETGDVTLASALTTDVGPATDADTSNNSVTDTVTVISGDVDVNKEHGLDTNCDGALEVAYGQAALQANPGECIAYRLSADNVGSATVTNVVISDLVPNFTSLEVCAANACAPALTVNGAAGTVGVQPADEATGSVASSTPTSGFSLAPGSRAVLTYTVQIDE